MSDELKYLSKLAAMGRLDRRAFLGRAAALGVTATFANTMLAGAARAADPVKGGTMRVGLGGGQSTDSFDPALATNEAPNTMLSFFGGGLGLGFAPRSFRTLRSAAFCFLYASSAC